MNLGKFVYLQCNNQLHPYILSSTSRQFLLRHHSPEQLLRSSCSPSTSLFLLCLKSRKQPFKMQNEEGQNMDLYIPRKCSATNRLITSKDHASVQINIGHLGPDGVYTNQFTTFALCGFIRAQGDADSAVDRLWQKKKAELRQ
ncbi:hypothetical protein BT93_B1395 [Corymbia citriodora subsp. variegata]|nr:hypothetical protein BT93_B1395 [Corymbia citriodora subsp. variegata]